MCIVCYPFCLTLQYAVKREREKGEKRLMRSEVHQNPGCESYKIRNPKLEEGIEKADI